MDRSTRNLFALALVAIVAVTGAAAFLLGGTALRDPEAPKDAQAVVGVIVGVDAASLDRVNGFSLRTTDRGTLRFTLGELENGAEFPPGHLAEHQALASPIRVWYRTEGIARVAFRIEDAE